MPRRRYGWRNNVGVGSCGVPSAGPPKSAATTTSRCCATQRFSVRVGTVLQGSHPGYRTWVLAIHLLTTSLKVQSSMQLHRDLNITQKTAWFLAHGIRKAFGDQYGNGGLFSALVEADETYVGSKRSNMSKALADTGAGRDTVGKTLVAGAKDRATNQAAAEVVPSTAKPVLQGLVGSRGTNKAVMYIGGSSV